MAWSCDLNSLSGASLCIRPVPKVAHAGIAHVTSLNFTTSPASQRGSNEEKRKRGHITGKLSELPQGEGQQTNLELYISEPATTSMFFNGYIHYRGINLPPVAHTKESLDYAQNFSVEDTDVFAVTYPKSGSVPISHGCCLFSAVSLTTGGCCTASVYFSAHFSNYQWYFSFFWSPILS